MEAKSIYQQIVDIFNKLEKSQKRIVLLTLIGVAAFIAFLIVFRAGESSFDDGYRVLFDGINSKDAALIVQQLEKDEIPYKLTDETTIKVPKEFVYTQRLKVAAQGLPKSSARVGFEIFDKKEFGSTEFDQNVKYLRALEGELSKTIESLTPIYKATVHLAIPKESVFIAKQTPPSASITLTLNESMTLNSKQIRGIKNLVAAAVSRLESINVQVVNEEGVPLGDDDEAGATDEIAKIQMKYKKDYENNLERKIVSLLAPIIGSKQRVVAKVSIEFDFTKHTQQEEKFDPNNVVRSEQLMEEKREGKKPKEVGGVPGAVSNIGPVQGVGSQATEKYEKSDVTTNYEISKIVSNTQREFAIVKRLTAAVVVDGKYVEESDEDGNTQMKFYKLSDEQLNSITNMVKQSIGFNVKRNDEVVVSNFQFDSNIVRTKVKTSFELYLEQIIPLLPYLKYLFAIMILFIFYKLVITPFRDKMLEIKTDEEEEHAALLKLGELEEDEGALSNMNELKNRIEKELSGNQEMDESSMRADVMLTKIKEAIEKSPEEACTLFETLLYDGEDDIPTKAST